MIPLVFQVPSDLPVGFSPLNTFSFIIDLFPFRERDLQLGQAFIIQKNAEGNNRIAAFFDLILHFAQLFFLQQ